MRLLSAFAVGVCMTLPGLAAADIFGAGGAKQVFRSQARVLEKRARADVRPKVELASRSFVTPTKWGPAKEFDGTYRGRYLAMARAAAQRHGVPQDLFLRLVQQESGWNAGALSPKGAIGLAQLMPETAARLGVNPRDPYENLDGGARYLARQYRAFRSWRLALAAYNAGPKAVEKHGGVPPYEETRNYVKVIWGS